MKVHRTEKDGIGIWRLSGLLGFDDAVWLVGSLKDRGGPGRGCFILDFEKVEHADYRAFRVLEEASPWCSTLLLCGLNDYVLGIFAFASGGHAIRVFRDWREAYRYLVVERGKLHYAVPLGAVGNE